MGQMSVELALAIFLPFLGILGGVVWFFIRRLMQRIEKIMETNVARIQKQEEKASKIEGMFAVINEKLSNVLAMVDYKAQLAELTNELAVIKERKG